MTIEIEIPPMTAASREQELIEAVKTATTSDERRHDP